MEPRGTPHTAAKRVIWVTALSATADHAVTPAEPASGMSNPARGIVAVCGDRFSPAPLVAEPGSSCLRCIRYLRARAAIVTAKQRLAHQRFRHRSAIGRSSNALRLGLPVSSLRCPRIDAPPGEAASSHARRDRNAVGFRSRRVSTASPPAGGA